MDEETTTVVVDASTLDYKIIAGYQGWFNADGDGSGLGWRHWAADDDRKKKKKPNAENINFDMWPDLRELNSNELYSTSFEFSDGCRAGLYSSYRQETVGLHMKWMKEYGIDGVFVQRFIVETKGVIFRDMRDRVLQSVRTGAETYGRVFANMYDISGAQNNKESLVDDIKNDWIHLVDDLGVTESDRYLRHKGRPVLSIWGFNIKGRPGRASQALELIDWLTKEAPEKYRATVKLGVNDTWRDDDDDSSDDDCWQNVYHSAHIISPWTVGRYVDENGADAFRRDRIEPDLAQLSAKSIDYMPVVFPGFSWANLKRHENHHALNQIPRNGGCFLWRQYYNSIDAGCRMIYVAMFDEVNESTAIFKITENSHQTPTTGRFVTLDQDGKVLPSDWYLRLTGEATKMLRHKVNLTECIPIHP